VKRGDLVTVALPGDLGKPRPALIIQSDLFDAHPSVAILPVTRVGRVIGRLDDASMVSVHRALAVFLGIA
jgi:mRNA interferase MazF